MCLGVDSCWPPVPVRADGSSLRPGVHEEGDRRGASTVMYSLRHRDNDKGLVKSMDAIHVHLLTDCRSLEEHLRQAGLHTVLDKRLAVDLSRRQVV